MDARDPCYIGMDRAVQAKSEFAAKFLDAILNAPAREGGEWAGFGANMARGMFGENPDPDAIADYLAGDDEEETA